MKATAPLPSAALRWELQATGWPPGSPLVTVVGSVALTLGALLSLAGVTVDYSLGSQAWSVPLVLPVLLALAAVQAVRYARWRSTSWGLSADGQRALRLGGVLRSGVVRSAPAARPTRKLLAGLTPASARALAEALRGGTPPSRPPASRGTWRSVFGILLYAGLVTGVSWTAAAANRRAAARLQALSSTVSPLVGAAAQQVDALLRQEFAAQVQAEPSLTAAQRSETLASFGQLVNDGGSSSCSGPDQVSWRIKRSLPTVLPVRGAWHDEVPCVDVRVTCSGDGLRVERFDAAGPYNQAFLDLLLPQLQRAGLACEPVQGEE